MPKVTVGFIVVLLYWVLCFFWEGLESRFRALRCQNRSRGWDRSARERPLKPCLLSARVSDETLAYPQVLTPPLPLPDPKPQTQSKKALIPEPDPKP